MKTALRRRVNGSAPKVSVCIPAYNRADTVGRAISSVLMQDFDDYEIVVSDDASTDATPEGVRGFSDPRIRYRRNAVNLGFPGNMNRTLEMARGQYVVFLCHDDFWFQGFLRREVELLDEHPSVSFVHCAARCLGINSSTSHVHTWPRIVPGRDFIVGKFSGKKSYFFSSVMARRELVVKVGGFNESFLYNADEYTWLWLALEGDVGYVADCLAGCDEARGALSAEFAENGRYVVEELRVKARFIDLACARSPELAELRRTLLSLMSLSLMRSVPSVRRVGGTLSATFGLWGRCVSNYPLVLARPASWLCLAGGLLPAGILGRIRYHLRKTSNGANQGR